ncbi:MAG: EAL domain-containing protein [Myxococcota bacterium]
MPTQRLLLMTQTPLHEQLLWDYARHTQVASEDNPLAVEVIGFPEELWPRLEKETLDLLLLDQVNTRWEETHRLLLDREGGSATPVLLLNQSTWDELLSLSSSARISHLTAVLDPALLRRRALLETRVYTRSLEATEARLRTLIESNLDGIVILDAKGDIRFVNRAVEELLGHRREQLLGQPFGIPVVERSHSKLQVLVGGEARILELRLDTLQWEGESCHLAFLRDVTARHRQEQILRSALRRNSQLVAAISSLHLGVIIANAREVNLPVLFANHGFSEISGYGIDDVLDQPFPLLKGRATDAGVVEQAAEALRNGHSFQGELLCYRQDGSEFWSALTLNPVFDGEGNLLSMVGVLQDVTEQRHAAQALRDSEANLKALIESTSDLICSLNKQGQIIACNVAFRNVTFELTGVELGRGAYLLEYLDFANREAWQQYLHIALEGESFTEEMVLNVGNRKLSYEICFSPVRTPDGQVMGTTIFARDITARKLAEEQLLHNAFHDSLTGLPNRALLGERLERAFSRARRRPDGLVAMLQVGPDRYRNITGSAGFSVGDRLIVTAAQRVEGCLRPSDTVARLTAEHFAVLLEDISEVSDALRVAERIHKAFEEPFHFGNEDFYVTVSIGIAIHEAHLGVGEILRDANTAYHRAARQGGNCNEVFRADMQEDANRKLKMESDLRKAISRGELMVYYQPIIALQTGRLAGFEALLRWKHPTWGFVRPDEFIALAEDNGLIMPIGQFALERACAQLTEWDARFPQARGLSISVNLSPKQTLQGDLIKVVKEALSQSRLGAQRLKLEVTEGVFVENLDHLKTVLAELAQLGVQLQLDDFGTKYSTLLYLHELPLHFIKIDQSFVKRLGPQRQHVAVVQTIQTLSHQLNMQVVAEGIEEPYHARILTDLGVEFGQGFHFAKPMPVVEVERLLSMSRPPWAGSY